MWSVCVCVRSTVACVNSELIYITRVTCCSVSLSEFGLERWWDTTQRQTTHLQLVLSPHTILHVLFCLRDEKWQGLPFGNTTEVFMFIGGCPQPSTIGFHTLRYTFPCNTLPFSLPQNIININQHRMCGLFSYFNWSLFAANEVEKSNENCTYLWSSRVKFLPIKDSHLCDKVNGAHSRARLGFLLWYESVWIQYESKRNNNNESLQVWI